MNVTPDLDARFREAALREGLPDQLQRLLALKGGDQLKFGRLQRTGCRVKQGRLQLCDSGLVRSGRAEDFPEVGVDGRIIVHDEDAMVGGEHWGIYGWVHLLA